jgi:hypothetical protein
MPPPIKFRCLKREPQGSFLICNLQGSGWVRYILQIPHRDHQDLTGSALAAAVHKILNDCIAERIRPEIATLQNVENGCELIAE